MTQNPLELMLAQAVGQVGQPQQAMPALSEFEIPRQEPLMQQGQLRDILAQALQPQPVSQDARSRALLSFGANLMQAPKPGQSIAGMVGQAATGAVNQLDQAQAQENAQRVARANTAMQVAGFEEKQQANAMAQKKSAFELRELSMRAKYLPQEKQARVLQDLAQAQQALASGRRMDADAALLAVKTEFADDMAKADLELTRARASEARAAAERQKTMLTHDKRNAKQTTLPDGSLAISEYRADGSLQRIRLISPVDALQAATIVDAEIATGKLKKAQRAQRIAELAGTTATKMIEYDEQGREVRPLAQTQAEASKVITTEDIRKRLSTQDTGVRPITR